MPRKDKFDKHGRQDKPHRVPSNMLEEKPVYCPIDGLELDEVIDSVRDEYDVFDGHKITTTLYFYTCPQNPETHPVFRMEEVTQSKPPKDK